MENNKSELVKEVDIVFMARKIRILGIAILLGIVLIYGFGLTVLGNYVNQELAAFNLISFIICAVLCIPSVFIKKMLMKDLNGKNFMNKYFNAHIIPFAMCDLGGLFCIATNLFVNSNIIYASAGFLLAAAMIILNFPRSDDYNRVKSL
ncbi:MAG: hypothetical protein HY959_06160 [Ignavibacteriae bacterium]|nr:hypothetical protein [Ignavibacteriota bacterium]